MPGPAKTFEPFFCDAERLDALAARLHGDYANAVPFPHIVIDDFLPEDVLDRVVGEFPPDDHQDWSEHSGYGWIDAKSEELQQNDYRVLGKLALWDTSRMGPHSRQLFSEVNSSTFLKFLEQLTGIQGVLPDPHLIGAGLHSTGRGGRLRAHADFAFNRWINLDRRLNLLVYLNRDWQEDWGGHLELWNEAMSEPVHRVLPVFNRCVIFSTTSKSFHGHAEVHCPKNVRRKSLALYYHTPTRPEGDKEDWHVEQTVWQREPMDRRRGGGWRQLVPPFAIDLYHYLKWNMSAKKLLPPALSAGRNRNGQEPTA